MEYSKHNIDLKNGKHTATSVWGDGDLSTARGSLRYVIKQLEFFLKNGRSPDVQHTRRDLKGYREVWATGSENIAAEFFRIKSEAREAGKPFANNLAVNAYLKTNGLWKP